MTTSGRFHRIAGFSLIELIVVLVILAVMGGLASMSLRGVVAKKRLTDAVLQLQLFDNAWRREARVLRRSIPARIDAQNRTATIESRPSRAFRIGDRIQIEQVRIDGQSSQLIASGDGVTPDYAVKLRCDDVTRWVMFAGGSGQLFQSSEEENMVRLTDR